MPAAVTNREGIKIRSRVNFIRNLLSKGQFSPIEVDIKKTLNFPSIYCASITPVVHLPDKTSEEDGGVLVGLEREPVLARHDDAPLQ